MTLPCLQACFYHRWGPYGKEHYADVRYGTHRSWSAAEDITVGCFYPSSLLASELLECQRGGRELSQALHLSSSLRLWCKAVAGEHEHTWGVCEHVCSNQWLSLHAQQMLLHLQPCKPGGSTLESREQLVFCLVTVSVLLQAFSGLF